MAVWSILWKHKWVKLKFWVHERIVKIFRSAKGEFIDNRILAVIQFGNMLNTVLIGSSRGRARHTPIHIGPNSFIFAYIFTEKCPRRRSTPP